MILCLGTTPATQRVMVFHSLKLDAVNRAAATRDGAAGKSVNVAKVLHALGEHSLATGFLGGDRGEQLRAILTTMGIAHEFVRVAAPTRQCVTLIDEAAGTVTELVEESRPVEPSDHARLWDVLQRRVPGCRAVVMSGTIPPGGPLDLYAQATRLAHAAGALAVVDAQGPPLLKALQASPGLVKPNRPELAATLGRALPNETSVVEAMLELHARGARQVVVTAGPEPGWAFDGRTCWRIRAPRIPAVNPIGSGDAFTAGVTWRLLRGEDLAEACRWGCAAGAANALTLMAGEVHRAEVERLVQAVQLERMAPG